MTKNVMVAWMFFIWIAISGLPSFAQAEDTVLLSKGQILYVPVYSHIYAGNRELPLLLTVTLSIRNVDTRHPLTLTVVDYYGTKGEILKKYLERDIVLGPLESTRYIIPQKEKEGGSGANFLVAWKAGKPINPPLIESIMIGAGGQHGISFTSRGQIITTSN